MPLNAWRRKSFVCGGVIAATKPNVWHRHGTNVYNLYHVHPRPNPYQTLVSYGWGYIAQIDKIKAPD